MGGKKRSAGLRNRYRRAFLVHDTEKAAAAVSRSGVGPGLIGAGDVTADILKGYAEAAQDLIDRYEAISSADLFLPVQDHLPDAPCRVLDVGAGTGRDAAWFAARSHKVVAVEPVDAFRKAGLSRHRSHGLSWIDDTLPDLSKTRGCGLAFDFVVLSAVWHHLDRAVRPAAFAALKALTAKGGVVVLSLRHGREAPGRRAYPVCAADTRRLAARAGFSIRTQVHAPSLQLRNRDTGVTWTWLVLQS